jgi:hypothetical protein
MLTVQVLSLSSLIILQKVRKHRWCKISHHHHQPINVPTAGAQPSLWITHKENGPITHHAGPVRVGGC